MTIYLIRHGEKESGVSDPGLTTIGKRQARATGKHLSQFPISRIISSPFRRTVETAQHIGSVLGLTHEVDDALVERMEREVDRVNRDQFFTEWVKATHDRTYKPSYGDSSYFTGQRIQMLIESLADSDDHVVLVSHGGAIVDYLRNTFGDAAVAQLQRDYDLGTDYEMRNCAINTVVLGTAPKIELLNFVEHLLD